LTASAHARPRPLPALPRPRARPALCHAALAGGLLAFALFAADLLAHGPVTRADAGVSAWFHMHMDRWVTDVLLGVTHLHGTTGVCVMVALLAALLFFTRNTAWLPMLAVCVPGGLLLNFAVKHVFNRARPSFDHPLLTLSSSSFPSGHTAGATLWWGFLLVLWWTVQPRAPHRAAAAFVALLMIALTALSRVYLGVHYLSDVLAAFGEGVAWLAVCFLVFSRVRR
jgi:membrane-associated phospholipid phosphatase